MARNEFNLDTHMVSFFDNFVQRYHINDSAEFELVKKYILKIKVEVSNPSDFPTFLYFPKDISERIRKVFRVYDDCVGLSNSALERKMGIDSNEFSFILMDFNLSLQNEILKKLKNKRLGIDDSINYSEQVGLHVLCLEHNAYLALKYTGFNTVQDLLGICTYKLFSLKNIGPVYFVEIIKKVHNKGYKFVDERKKSIEELRELDFEKVEKKYKQQLKRFRNRK